MTPQTVRVLEILMAAPTEEHYGFEVAKAARLASGSLYPILARLEGAGIVESDWEQGDTERPGPRRRYYRLSREGADQARALLAGRV